MKIRATLLMIAKLAAAGAAVTSGLAACGTHQGKLVVDTPVLPYTTPDISEITGIEEPDSDSEDGSGSGSAEPGK